LPGFEVCVPNFQNVQDYGLTDAAGASLSRHIVIPTSLEMTACGADGVVFGVPAPSGIELLTFGDPVRSVRSLIKRFTVNRLFVAAAVGGAETFSETTFVAPGLPETPGIRGSVAASYNAQSWLSWYSMGYLALRGGARWKLQCFISAGSTFLADPGFAIGGRDTNMAAFGSADSKSFIYTSMFAATTQLKASVLARMLPNGGQTFSLAGGRAVEIEMPAVNPFRYTLALTPTKYGVNFVNGADLPYGTDEGVLRIAVFSSPPAPTTAPTIVIVYVAAAEDTSLTWFVAAPTVRALNANRKMGGA